MHLLSVDLEDWYTDVARVPGVTTREASDALERQVAVLERILDATQTRCTFFVLGTTAERYPALVARLARKGHEIAAHGYTHVKLGSITAGSFERDIARARDVLAAITGTPPVGYRAPFFSLGDAPFTPYPYLAGNGYRYSSSTRASVPSMHGGVHEIPSTALHVGRLVVPLGGGGWWRALPRRLVLAWARRGRFATYVHPHELDPRPLRGRSVLHHLYVNTGRAGIAGLLEALLRAHRFTTYEEATRVRG